MIGCRPVLRYAAAADRRSAHPLAKAVVAAAQQRGISVPDAEEFRTIHGCGVSAVVEAREVLVGNQALMDEHTVMLHGQHENLAVPNATGMYSSIACAWVEAQGD